MSKLIIALDFSQAQQALEFVERLNPQHCAIKIGSELFTRSGPSIVADMVRRGFRVFLDLKWDQSQRLTQDHAFLVTMRNCLLNIFLVYPSNLPLIPMSGQWQTKTE